MAEIVYVVAVSSHIKMGNCLSKSVTTLSGRGLGPPRSPEAVG